MLIDDGQCGLDATGGHRAHPLVERDGEDWGAPADDAAAVGAAREQRARGVRFLAHVWTAAWWRDAYPGLFASLGAPVVANERLSLYWLP